MTPTPPSELARRLESTLAPLKSVVVAYSGGVDSAVVLAAAVRALGDRAVALLAISPSYPPWEYEDARSHAREIGAELVEVRTDELDNPLYARNAPDRCFHCKSALFDACETLRVQRGLGAIAYGAQMDDLGDDRPGQRAASQRGIRAPLIDAGLDKVGVRAVAAHYGLRTATKPALACLSSRIPHGTPVNPELLDKVGRAEHALRQLGLVQVRVRVHGDMARIELALDEMPRLLDPATRQSAVAGVTAAGFHHVTVDLQGYRPGGANARGAPRLQVLA